MFVCLSKVKFSWIKPHSNRTPQKSPLVNPISKNKPYFKLIQEYSKEYFKMKFWLPWLLMTALVTYWKVESVADDLGPRSLVVM